MQLDLADRATIALVRARLDNAPFRSNNALIETVFL
jgi:hypothetical protein